MARGTRCGDIGLSRPTAICAPRLLQHSSSHRASGSLDRANRSRNLNDLKLAHTGFRCASRCTSPAFFHALSFSPLCGAYTASPSLWIFIFIILCNAWCWKNSCGLVGVKRTMSCGKVYLYMCIQGVIWIFCSFSLPGICYYGKGSKETTFFSKLLF